MSDAPRVKSFLRPLSLLAALAFALSLAGCATVPSGGIPTFTIRGASYVPLDAVCASRGIHPDYDALTRTVAVSRNSAALRFQVGRGDLLVNGDFAPLSSPVALYRGMVVIPLELRRRIDELFPEETVSSGAFRRLRKVVVDAGHGGKDPGATGPHGVREKDVVLDIARKLRDGLKKEDIEVVMTRDSDTFIPLETRAQVANKNGVDLFVSIHANANRTRSLKGFEVYYISPAVSDNKRAVATAKNIRPNFDADCFASQSLDLKAIIWDMTYAYDRRESIELSRTICRAMGGVPDIKVLGVKNANFSVLRGSTMPAVLVEVGFLSNPAEESLIASEPYRRKLAERIKEGIRYYCEGLGELIASKKEGT